MSDLLRHLQSLIKAVHWSLDWKQRRLSETGEASLWRLCDLVGREAPLKAAAPLSQKLSILVDIYVACILQVSPKT